MSKQLINMVGGSFQHSECSSLPHNILKSVEWVKGNHSAPISIHIDGAIYEVPINNTKQNYGWLCESRSIMPQVYGWCSNNIKYIEDNFELVFTHDMRWVELFNPLSPPCIPPKFVLHGLSSKSKFLAIINPLHRINYGAGISYIS